MTNPDDILLQKLKVREYVAMCSSCDGSGFNDCGPTFDGRSAAVTCSSCSGTGRRTQWSDQNGSYYSRPRYVTLEHIKDLLTDNPEVNDKVIEAYRRASVGYGR